jgi:hypothetical protein
MFIQLRGDGKRLINVTQINTLAISITPEKQFCVSFIMINELEINSEKYDTIEEAQDEYDDIYRKLYQVLNPRQTLTRR